MSAEEGETIARRVLETFGRADARYVAMSGWRLHTAPEYFATVAIAKRLAKVHYVTLEQNINNAVAWSGGQQLEANADNLSSKGRFDLAVWGKKENDAIQGVIEVKLGTWFTYATVGGDVRRVCAALRRAPRLDWGMCAFHFACWREVSKPGAARVDERMRRILESSQRHAAKNGMTCRPFLGQRTPVEDWNGWTAGCAGGAALLFERQET